MSYILNLTQYLRTQKPEEIIYANTRTRTELTDQVPDRNVLVRSTGGVETGWFQFQINSFQIVTRDIDQVKAEKLSFDIHEEINNKFGLILPEVTIDGNTYPQVISAQISVNTLPQSVGFDEEGRAEFSANYRIIFKEN